MANRIAPKRSNVASAVPTTGGLVEGELATNSADKTIYQRVGLAVVAIANYFDAANVRSTLLTGFSIGAPGTIAATDSVLGAFGKIQATLNYVDSEVASTVSDIYDAIGLKADADDFESGAFTPTVTVTLGGGSVTQSKFTYTRMGSVVTVTGSMSFAPAVAGFNALTVTLPVAVDFTAMTDAGGAGSVADLSTTTGGSALVTAEPTSDLLALTFFSFSTGSHIVTFTSSYEV